MNYARLMKDFMMRNVGDALALLYVIRLVAFGLS